MRSVTPGPVIADVFPATPVPGIGEALTMLSFSMYSLTLVYLILTPPIGVALCFIAPVEGGLLLAKAIDFPLNAAAGPVGSV